MKIAQVAPLIESVPPRLYGGTERVVSYLTEELIRQGHEVTLFATGDSITQAKLVASAPGALRLDPSVIDYTPHHVLQLEHVRQRADDFDVIHFHLEFLHFPMLRGPLGARSLTTLHGRLDLADYRRLFREFRDIALTSISDPQRLPLPDASWLGTVHHGLPSWVCPFEPHPRGDYLAFLGRISRDKRPDRAIQIAERTGVPLKIAAKIDRADQEYFRSEIEPLLRGSRVELIGEVDERQKADFLGNALALLFPIDWPEPFGLALIEAMSCGTPCIAWRCGSVPELVDPDITGFIVDSIEDAAAAVKRAEGLDRRAIRSRFEQRFSAERMAKDYLEIYRALLDRQRDPLAA